MPESTSTAQERLSDDAGLPIVVRDDGLSEGENDLRSAKPGIALDEIRESGFMTAGAEPISSATNKTDTAPPRFHWHIDEIFGEQVAGWIMLPDQPAHRCIVALKERGQVIAQTIASRFRNDLVLAGIGDGCYSFLLPMPQALFDGAE